MLKFLKWLGIVLGVIILAIGGFLLYLNFQSFPMYDVQKIDLKVDVTPERVTRGKKIFSMVCAQCHLNPTTQQLTGKKMDDAPEMFGPMYSRNITQHPEKGIGKWTDGEIAYILRTGVNREGRGTLMPRFAHLSDEDVNSIISLLRSDDPWVQPVDVDDYDSQPTLLTKILLRTVFKATEYPKEAKISPDPSDKVAYGKYLATGMLDCYACHSASFTSIDAVNPEKSEGFFGGGNEMKDYSGRTIYTPNITMDEETGIGKWTEQDFIRAVRHGFRPDNTYIRIPMTRFVELTDEEVSAIWAYLQTVPKLKNPNKKGQEVNLAESATEGQKIYYKYSCQSCHGDNGLGACDLRQAHQKYSSNADLKKWIEDPSQFVKDSKMPTWKDVIQENEYEPLMEFVRQLGEKASRPSAMLIK